VDFSATRDKPNATYIPTCICRARDASPHMRLATSCAAAASYGVISSQLHAITDAEPVFDAGDAKVLGAVPALDAKDGTVDHAVLMFLAANRNAVHAGIGASTLQMAAAARSTSSGSSLSTTLRRQACTCVTSSSSRCFAAWCARVAS